jgi:hypothetical protein
MNDCRLQAGTKTQHLAHMSRQSSARAARRSARLSILLLAAVGACDMPTRLPTWDQTWLIPGDSTSIAVSELLPSSGDLTMTTVNGQPAFALTVASPGTYSQSLGQICSACATANGTTVPKPAFVLRDSVDTSLPSDVVAATIVSGTFTYTVTNNFSFDPIRPNAAGAPYGYFVVTVKNGSTVVARDSVDGAALAMGKNGATVQRSLSVLLNNGSLAITGASPLRVYLTLNSPQGDPVTINASQSISVAFQPAPVALSQAQVQIGNQSISATQTNIDFSSVSDQAVINRVQGGTLHLVIASPFGVQGTLTATFTAPGTATITKTLPLTTAAQQTPDISLTADELRSLLGKSVTLSVSGTVSSPSGTVTLTPTQVLQVNSTFQIILSTTES